MTRRRGAGYIGLAALAGVISAGVFLAVAEVVALLTGPGSSPLLAVGSFVIDIVPRPLKEFAITTFGDLDKVALLAGLGVAVVVAASLAGILQYLRPPLGVVLLAVAAVLSGAAILTRAGASPLMAIGSIAGFVVGSILLILLARRLRGWRDAAASGSPTSEAAAPNTTADGTAASDSTADGAAASTDLRTNRRGFLTMAGISAAAAVVAGIGARVVSATTSSIDAVREALNIPAPRSKVTIPDGAELDVEGITPLITPNADFYRVDTALTVPTIDPSTWRLVIDGMVDTPLELSFDDITKMGLDEYGVTLTCVSNEVGGGLVGNAIWTGVPIRDILRMAGPAAGADMVLSTSVDGYTASTPLSALVDDARDAILAVTMNGEPLPLEHGFPVRMVVPGLYGYVSATKWLTQLTVTTFEKDQAYWTPRGYSAEAPIKLSSRVDTPKTGTPVTAGAVAIGGMAWAQTVGIQTVEVSIDDADWMPATLSNPINDDSWVQWRMDWDASPGTHYIAVRATDKAGNLQIEERAPIAPNGSSGWQRLLVTVR